MDKVHELRITIPADSFRAMQEDLKTIGPGGGPLGMLGFGARGAGGAPPIAAFLEGGAAAFLKGGAAACSGKAAASPCSVNGLDGQCVNLGDEPVCLPMPPAGIVPVGGGRGARPFRMTSRDPMYVPVSVTHDGREWTGVGMRYKGNSSLMAANAGMSGKIPFRLEFDRYEDQFPGTRDQRFYGFQKLTFSSNFTDDSQIREVFATEIFRDRGVPAARAAFYRVFVDSGGGSEYWGLYSMIEDPADGAMLDTQFGGRQGNLYKPEGPGADWSQFNAEGFEKKTNQKEADFSDVSRAIAALHAPRSDPRAWRSGLEATFDVDLFLRWLAVNTVIQNWDVYGAIAHNYYLYGDPAQKGRLRWIPWDNNMALGMGMGGLMGGRGFMRGAPPAGAPFPAAPGGPPPGGPPAAAGGPPRPMIAGLFGSNGDVLHRQVGSQWPLIQFLLADQVYAARYRELLEHALGGLFAPAAAEKRMQELHALIAPSIVGERGERPTHTTISSRQGFEGAVVGPGGLRETLQRRREAVRAALDGVSPR